MRLPELERWLADGLITPEQAAAIEQYEAAREVPAPRPARRGGVVAEVVGSLGALAAAIAAVVGTSVLWDDLTSFARVAVPVVGAVALLAAGAAVPRRGEASITRLGALLWLLGAAATAAAVAVALVELTDLADQNVVLLTGIATLGLALILAHLRPSPHLVGAITGGAVLAAIGVVGQYDRATGAQYGAALVAVGLGVMLFGWAGALASPGAAYVFGGAVAFVGAQLFNDVADHWPVVIGLTIGVASLAAFIAERHRALLVVGLAFSLVFLVQGIVLATESNEPGGRTNTGVVLAAFAVGVVLLAGALFAIRRRE